jgi:IclR family KDG regulon transcriptional repressor
MSKKYNLIQSVGRAFAILEQFSQDERELGVTVIAQRVGLHKSTCFGLLYTLQEMGYIQQNPETGRYSLGLKIFELGQAYLEGQDLRQLANPYLRRLVEQTQETVHLVVLEGHRAVYIDKVEGTHAMTISSRIGQRAKMHCTGVGKALLAHMYENDISFVLSHELEKFTDNTIIDPENLREHLSGIRRAGYAIDDEEIEIGLRCVAAPIFNSHNQAFAAISMSGPSGRITRERLGELSKLVCGTAREISRQLGNGVIKRQIPASQTKEAWEHRLRRTSGGKQ